MSERRDAAREKVMYGATATTANMHVTLRVERIGLKRPASVVWRHVDTVGVAFSEVASPLSPRMTWPPVCAQPRLRDEGYSSGLTP